MDSVVRALRDLDTAHPDGYSRIGAVCYGGFSHHCGYLLRVGPPPSQPRLPLCSIIPCPDGALQEIDAENARLYVRALDADADDCVQSVLVNVRPLHTCDLCEWDIVHETDTCDHAFTDDVYDVCQTCADTDVGAQEIARRGLRRIQLPARAVPGMGPLGTWVPVLKSRDPVCSFDDPCIAVWVNLDADACAQTAIQTSQGLEHGFQVVDASLQALLEEANQTSCAAFVAKYADTFWAQ